MGFLSGKFRVLAFLGLAALLHLAAFAWIRFPAHRASTPSAREASVFKLVDVEDYAPPQTRKSPATALPAQAPGETGEPAVEEPSERVPPPAMAPTVSAAPAAEPETATEPSAPAESGYLPQQKISEIPKIPTADILSRVEYPPLALRRGIEGVVYLELYIDAEGRIQKAEVLKDPGYGFAEAALKALEGARCEPARANGRAVAVRYRYPVRFTLK